MSRNDSQLDLDRLARDFFSRRCDSTMAIMEQPLTRREIPRPPQDRFYPYMPYITLVDIKEYENCMKKEAFAKECDDVITPAEYTI